MDFIICKKWSKYKQFYRSNKINILLVIIFTIKNANSRFKKIEFCISIEYSKYNAINLNDNKICFLIIFEDPNNQNS